MTERDRILRLLASAANPWTSGADLVELGRGDIKRGRVYVTLSQMEEAGLVVSRSIQYSMRREYQITEAGRAELATVPTSNVTAAERQLIDLALITGEADAPRRPFGLFIIWLGVKLGWGKAFEIDEPDTYIRGFLQNDMVFVTAMRVKVKDTER